MITLSNLKVSLSSNNISSFELEIKNLQISEALILITGENGAGKSTLLRCLSEPSSFPHSLSLSKNIERIFAYDLIEIPTNLKVKEFLSYLGFSNSQEILRLLDLETKSQTFIKKLSVDQQDRLKLCYLFKDSYQLILIDELTRDFPCELAEKLIVTIMAKQSECQMVIADHNLDDNSGIFERIIELGSGRVKSDRKPSLRKKVSPKVDAINVQEKKHYWLPFIYLLRNSWKYYTITLIMCIIAAMASMGTASAPFYRSSPAIPALGVVSNQAQELNLAGLKYSKKKGFINTLFTTSIIDGQTYSINTEKVNRNNRLTDFKKQLEIAALSRFDTYGDLIISGNTPYKTNEVAVSKDLRSYVKNGQIEISHGATTESFNVTGFIRGWKQVSFSDKYLISEAMNNLFLDALDFKLIRNQEEVEFSFYTDEEEKIFLYMPEGEEAGSLEVKSSDNSLSIAPEELRIVKSERFAAYISFQKYESLLLRLNGKHQATLFYNDASALFKDRETLKGRGYTVYSSIKSPNSNLPAFYLAVIETALLTGLYIAVYSGFRRSSLKLKPLGNLPKFGQITIPFLTLSILALVPGLCILAFQLNIWIAYLIYFAPLTLAFLTLVIKKLVERKKYAANK